MLLEVKDLDISYGDKLTVTGASLELDKGEIMSIVGESGSGKTTVIRAIMGCLPGAGRVSRGSIIFDGEDITGKKVDLPLHRQKMGMVFQHFNLFPHKTILENLTLAPRKVKHLSQAEAEAKAMALLERVGLADRAGAYPAQLSGGQKQRVAIAGVIAMEPKVLILDEPTAGLDPRGREAILAQLRSYHKQKGNTVILVSHSMEEIARNVDRIVVMSHSHKLMDGTPEEVFCRAGELLQVGLDVPQVTKVAMELQKRGLLTDSSVYTIDELVRRLLALKGGEAAC